MNAVMRSESETPLEAAHRFARAAINGPFKFEAVHTYQDALARPYLHRWRARLPSGSKAIRPFHWNGESYVPGEPRAPANGKPLYRLPELIAADAAQQVLVVEGEKCADLLAELGLVVTTSGAADSARAADWSPLRGRRCLVWPDHDKAGAKYADTVAEQLRDVGCIVDVLDVAALGLPEKGDCVEWLLANPQASAKEVLALPRVVATASTTDDVLLIEAAELNPEPIRWLWPGWLARGKLHVLAGAPGTGKTTLAMDIAACVSAGRSLPSGCRPPRGHVLIWSGEDDPSDTLVPRLIAAGADMKRVRFIGDVHENGERYPFDPANDVPKLAAAVARIADVALLIVDPLVSAVRGDSHKNAEVRRGLAPLVDLAARLDAALLGITHYSKGTQGRDPLERVSGSLAFGALARIVLGTVRQESEEGESRKMMLARAKSNIGPDGGGFAYAFEEIVLPEHGGLTASRIVWGDAIEGTARELLAEADTESGESGDAASFLRDLLGGAPRPAKDVYREAEGAGYSRDQMKRAKRQIGAEAVKVGMDGGWLWRLPSREGSTEGSEGSGQHRPHSSLPSGRETLPSEAIEL